MARKWYESAKLENFRPDDKPEKMLRDARIAAAVPVEHAHLGLGCNTFTGDVRGKVLIADEALIELDDKQGQDKWFNLEYIENKHELSKKMEVSASASYLGFFSVKSKFVNEQNFKRESVYLLVSVLVTNCRAEFKEYKPSEDFTKFIAKDPINWNTFLKKYGNEFIFSIATGGEFYALYEFHFESIQDKKKLEVQIKSSGWGFKAGGEFKNALDKIDTNVNITCNLYIRGGKGKLPEPKGDKIIEAALQFPEAVDLKYGAPIDYKAETKDYYVVENFPGFPDDIDENLDNNEKICDNISEELAKIEVLEQSDFDPSNKKKLVEIKDHLIAEIQKIASNPISRHQEPTHIFDEVKEIESEEMWTLVPGKLTQVSVGSCEYVWGVNHKNEIRRWNNNEKKWEDKPGQVQSVSVGADGTTWANGLNKKSYRWDINRWINCGGAFEQISVGSKDQVWGIDTKGVVCQWKNEKWGKKSINGKLLSVGSDGNVYMIDDKNQVFKWNKDNDTPDSISGELSHITVGNASEIWGIDTKSQVVKMDEETWKQLSSSRKLVSISVGDDGEVWGVDGGANIFRLVKLGS